ncbi:hypothetical protein PRIPAC_95879 [Pristionchus pacificus]|uniref:Uncharacterized protein n=1 Tax=Pristionchus pacificus TaxID=54126 RepID=A0A2A6BJ13_PRIPA|nr:hypothetical protein PRIPAC_95879 [Pristionchus pacificus]|eukprot:PDM65791.1 hypothetical protein PRIPAC_45192 [Pristionchus pacificus]
MSSPPSYAEAVTFPSIVITRPGSSSSTDIPPAYTQFAHFTPCPAYHPSPPISVNFHPATCYEYNVKGDDWKSACKALCYIFFFSAIVACSIIAVSTRANRKTISEYDQGQVRRRAVTRAIVIVYNSFGGILKVDTDDRLNPPRRISSTLVSRNH